MSQVDWTIVLRAALAALLGFLIGWERKALGAPIRARATALAAATAAMLVGLTQMYYWLSTVFMGGKSFNQPGAISWKIRSGCCKYGKRKCV